MAVHVRLRSLKLILLIGRRTNSFSTGNDMKEEFGGSRIKSILRPKYRIV